MKVAVVALLLGAVPASAAEWKTGQRLYDDCVPTKTDICIGYIDGIVDAVTASAEASGRVPWICIPSKMNAGQVAALVIDLIEKDPEFLPLPAAMAVMLALGRKLPCRGSNPGARR
jgi:hypothetical protein